MIAQFQAIISFNPTRNITRAKVEKRSPKYLNLSQRKQLLANSIQTEKNNKIRNYAITCVSLNCCIRANELVLIDLTDITTEERSRKQAKLEYTYQQILATQAEQVNNKANLHNTNTKMAENMLESTNILDFDKLAKKA